MMCVDRSLNMEQEAREREKEKERTQSLTGLPAATVGPSGENSKFFYEHKKKSKS
jgi:hypothetical protein